MWTFALLFLAAAAAAEPCGMDEARKDACPAVGEGGAADASATNDHRSLLQTAAGIKVHEEEARVEATEPPKIPHGAAELWEKQSRIMGELKAIDEDAFPEDKEKSQDADRDGVDDESDKDKDLKLHTHINEDLKKRLGQAPGTGPCGTATKSRRGPAAFFPFCSACCKGKPRDSSVAGFHWCYCRSDPNGQYGFEGNCKRWTYCMPGP